MQYGVVESMARNALVMTGVSPVDATVGGDDPWREAPYALPEDHLSDLLLRLDLQLRRLLVGRGGRAGTDFLSFAAISDEEVLQLLGAPPSDSGPDGREATPAGDGPLLAGELAHIEARIAARVGRSRARALSLPLLDLADRVPLGPLEQDLLIIAAAAELDRRYERVFGYLQDDMGRKLPSLGLAVAVCTANGGERPGAAGLRARRLLGRAAPLRRYRLIEVLDEGAPTPWLAKPMRIDERILGVLLGDHDADTRIADLVQLGDGAPGRLPTSPRRSADLARLHRLLPQRDAPAAERSRPLVYLHGEPGSGAEDLFAAVASAHGLELLTADLAAVPAPSSPGSPLDLPATPPEALFLLLREAWLRDAALCLRDAEALFDADSGGVARRTLERGLAQFGGLVCLVGRGPWRWPLPAPPLVLRTLALEREGLTEQLAVWRGLLDRLATDDTGEARRIDDEALERLVSRHPLPLGRITEAWRMACDLAAVRGEGISANDLEEACRAGAPPPVTGLTRLIEPRHGWADLVLPAARMDQLRALCSQATHLATVYGAWGFERKLALGKGISALFSGPPGTGKTMAAEVIAAELALPLLKIDLSQVVSKYIGETEKNLRALFDQAAAAHAILFFDEADALLGKRSAVGDAHDRYANTEVAYLLQKMEEFEGITILATNLRQNMDDAFTRRMRFVVDFPFPEDVDRLRIWETVWPPEVPRAPDLDLGRLATQFRLCGGNIRNIAVAAAFLAAADRRPVDMGHLLHAARQELQKMGRLVSEAEDRFRV